MNRGFLVRSLIPAGLALGLVACSGSDGKNGQSCHVVNDAGTSTLVCDDGTSAPLGTAVIPKYDGGATNCTIQTLTGGVNKIVCPDGTEVVIPTSTGPTTGVSCTVVSNGDGTSSMTCPNGDGGLVTLTIKNAVSSYANMSAADKAALDLKVAVTSVTVAATGQPVVSLKATTSNGDGVAGLPPADVHFALLKLVPAVKGGNDTWVSYMAANATSTAGTETAAAVASATSGALTDNGDGSYTYTFAKVITNAAAAGTTYDPAALHRLVILIYESGNPYAPVNVVKDFVPATGADATGQHEIVDGATCLNCHSSFRAPAGGTGAFHSGTRYDVKVCVACHNDQRRFTAIPGTGTTPNVDLDAPGVVDPTTGAWTGAATLVNGEAFVNLPVFIHKIHMGEGLKLNGGSYTGVDKPYETTYPQDIRNCVKCHSNTPMAANFSTKPSRRACASCHDDVSFAAVAAIPAGRIAHKGGPMADDSLCAACHPSSAANNGTIYGVLDSHVAIATPDPTASNFGGSQTHTNAAWMPAAGVTPAGAAKITYIIKSVSRDASKHPSIVFQFQKAVPPAAATPVVFNASGGGIDGGAGSAEMMDGFVNSPSVYFAYALPQDGIKAPADFNKTVSGYIKTIWNGTAATTGTMTGPDASGYYTITLTATVPDSAVMLTGGIGYSYGTTSTQPLTEVDLPAFPYGDTTKVPGCAAGQVCGGLIMAAPDVSMVATDATSGKAYTARRAIVSSSTCIACHEQLGANPSFHADQRNDAGTCAFCHNPNLADGGWSVSSSTFIHGIHGGSERGVPYTWQATCPAGTSYAAGTCTIANADSYAKLTYPGILSNCQQCHLPGTYDFSATASAAALPNLLMSTEATGTYAAPGINISPYVTADNVTSYGTGYLTTGTVTTGTVNGVACTTAAPCTCSQDTPCEASDSTLVNSPITAACSACHNSPTYIDHMRQMGGTYYGTRLAAKAQTEQCMLCHGPGTVAAIADVHKM